MEYITKKKNNLIFSICLKVVTLAIFLLIFLPVTTYGMGFSDIPKDHWAYKAIMKLVNKGYMDGFADDTFRGRKVVSRYELAIILAKILDKVDDIETSGGLISQEDAKEIKNLSKNFKKELSDLGVKITSLENRVSALEKFKEDQGKVKVGGFYQARERFVWDRLSTKNDPDNWPLDEVDSNDKNGLSNLNQEIHLKITGKPSDQIEAYMELVGYLNQDYDAYWRYWNYKDPIMKETSITRPWLDNRMVDIQDNKAVYMDRAHLTFSSDYANVRVFADERFKKFDDPVNLLNGSGRNIMGSNTPRVYQGVETTGTVKDVSYQLSVLKERDNPSSTDYYIDDNTGKEGYYISTSSKDIYGARMVYKVPERILKTKTAEITLGTSFVERAKDYTKVGDFEEANGVDLSFKFTDIGTLKTNAEYLESRTGTDADGRIVKDNGFKIDSEYSLDNLTFIINHYKYGKDFKPGTTRYDSLLIDTSSWNYGRKGYLGEKLTRMTLKYDYKFADGQGIRTEGIAQQKKWDVDPSNPVYDLTAHLYSFQLWADISKYMNGRIYSYLKKDALKDEIGSTWTEIEFNGKFPDINNLSTQFRFATSSDRDSVNKEGDSKRYNEWYGEIAADIAPMVWSKIKGKRGINRIGWYDGNVDSPSTSNTESVTDDIGYETNVNISSDLSLKFDAHSQHVSYPNFPKENLKIKWFSTEINEVFTDKLKFKAKYWWKDYSKWSNNYSASDFYWSNDKVVDYPSNENNLRNWTMELTYEPFRSSKMRVIWGDWIDYKQDYKDIETERKLFFEMKTEF